MRKIKNKEKIHEPLKVTDSDSNTVNVLTNEQLKIIERNRILLKMTKYGINDSYIKPDKNHFKKFSK